MPLSPEVVSKLGALATLTDTTAVVVLRHGEVVFEHGKPKQRVEIMSVTKSIVSLLVGQLIEEGLLRLDQPVADFVPKWKDTPKAAIQIKHLLANTSGLEDKPTTEDIYASDSFVDFAIDAELKNPPGKEFFYSNRAVNLLAHVAKSAASQPLDVYARHRLFEPLGIAEVGWSHDKAGNIHIMAGIQMSAADLAKLGQLVLYDGVYCGKRVVAADWLRTSTEYQDVGFRPHGLLWWLARESTSFGFSNKLFAQWKASGVPEDFVAKFRPLEGKYFARDDFLPAVHQALTGKTGKPSDADLAPWYKMTWQAGRPDGEVKHGPVKAILGDGYGGQVLAIYPKQKLVLARLRDVSQIKDPSEKHGFLPQAEALLLDESPNP